MADKNAFRGEMVNPEDDDSTWKNTITSSGQICSTELLDSAIEDARRKKKTLVSAMYSVLHLKKQVECKEKVAEQAIEENHASLQDYYAELDDYTLALQHAVETNAMHSREICAQRAALADEMKDLELFVSSLLDNGDGSIAALDEMHRDLEMRMASARRRKLSSDEEKLKEEAVLKKILAYQKCQMSKVEEESKRLQQEAAENSKFQEFIFDHRHAVALLHGEISDKIRDVNLLREELDQGTLRSRLPIFTRAPIFASSSLSSTTSETPYQQPTKINASKKKGKKVKNGKEGRQICRME